MVHQRVSGYSRLIFLLDPVLLLSILGISQHVQPAAGAPDLLPSPVSENQCPCIGQTCKDSQNCVCLQSRTPKSCNCSCPEQLLGIPERPLPRVSCACRNFSCPQGQNCLCTESQPFPSLRCSCQCLERGIPPPPRVECPCGGYSCNKGEECYCRESSEPGTCICACYGEGKRPRELCGCGVTCYLDEVCECKDFEEDPSCICKCKKKVPLSACPCPGYGCRADKECQCGQRVDAKTGVQTCFCECV